MMTFTGRIRAKGAATAAAVISLGLVVEAAVDPLPAHAQQGGGGGGASVVRVASPSQVAPSAPTVGASAVAVPRAVPPVTTEFKDVNVREALERLFNAARVQYSIAPGATGKITLKMTDQPFEDALDLVLRSVSPPLTYRVENGVYLVEVIKVIKLKNIRQNGILLPAANIHDVSNPFEVEVNMDKTVNITGTGPVRDLLRQMMQATNADKGYFVAPDITGDTTVLLRKIPLAQALKLTLQNVSPRVTYGIEDGAYIFRAETDRTKGK